MNAWQEIFGATPVVGAGLSANTVMLSLLLSFVLPQVLGVTYTMTFRGMSYSRSFIQSLTLGSIVCAMLMLAINDNIAAGLGIAGSLAIIRFRTAIREPRDMVFVFAAMGAGIACGLRAYSTAVVGTLFFSLASFVMAVGEFGRRAKFDLLLRFRVPRGVDQAAIAQALQTHARRCALVTLRDVAQGAMVEHAYQIELVEERKQAAVLEAINNIEGSEDVTLWSQEPTIQL